MRVHKVEQKKDMTRKQAIIEIENRLIYIYKPKIFVKKSNIYVVKKCLTE